MPLRVGALPPNDVLDSVSLLPFTWQPCVAVQGGLDLDDLLPIQLPKLCRLWRAPGILSSCGQLYVSSEQRICVQSTMHGNFTLLWLLRDRGSLRNKKSNDMHYTIKGALKVAPDLRLATARSYSATLFVLWAIVVLQPL